MATYAIGDIQGCFGTLERLLERIHFRPGPDRLWLVGDLVNRGPRSLEVLRWARGLGEAAVTVLGNHDLHLLARAYGLSDAMPRDTLDEVLAAPDRDVLLDWLRRRPLLYREPPFTLVHAGLLPAWTEEDAEAEAREVATELQARPEALLAGWLAHRRQKILWQPALPAEARRATALRALTTLRTCTADGWEHSYDGPPAGAPSGYYPWFEAPTRRSTGTRVVFGHWAALGLSLGPSWVGTDSGCVWGRTLSAVRLEDFLVFQETAIDSPVKGVLFTTQD
ncbi:MAG TPA: symmetrical bis(5'-nucleosyl)-tetraphosphatase [Myxococcaceae bacterium]|nr:symmetrical bis(5'-nucleosyl)-tetraphosphatase [Myxococcaceae bacterium]